MKKQEELVIITKTYDLILWNCNHTGRFPRQHRYMLGERLERCVQTYAQFVWRTPNSPNKEWRASRRQHQPHNIAFPLSDGGRKKF
jgi:hypothetical protein